MITLRFRNTPLLTITRNTAFPFTRTAVNGEAMLTILRVDAGSAQLTVDKHQYRMRQGNLFVINEVEAALVQAVASDELRYTLLRFASSFVAPSENSTLDYGFLEMFYSREHIVMHKISGDGEQAETARRLFAEIEKECVQNTSDRLYSVKILLLQLLLAVLRYYRSDQDLNPDEGLYAPGNATIEAVVNYIEDNLSQTLSLSVFAEIAHMNPFYFSTFFKKHTSVSPMQYVLRARVKRAVRLLRETDKTILDIALLCGFNNTANFNKTFKKITGKTPSDYRAQRRKFSD